MPPTPAFSVVCLSFCPTLKKKCAPAMDSDIYMETPLLGYEIRRMTLREDGIVIAPRKEHPFVSPSDKTQYFCNICKRYSPDFYPSSIKTKDRRCRPCQALAQRNRSQGLAKIDRLLKKLKYNLIYNKQNSLARACRREHVVQILKHNGITTEDQLQLVKTISPNFDPVSKKWRYNVVYSDLLRR